MYQRAYIYFSLATLVAFLGFFPSYFSRLGSTDAAHHFHGIMASAWMLMLVLQAWLMRQKKMVLHRSIGKLSIVIAPLFWVSGLLVMHVMLASDSPFSKMFGKRLAFLDLTTILYFAFAYIAAIYYRSNVQLHARFMASTAILVLPPALARFLGNYVPGVSSFEMGVHGSYLISELIVVLLLLDDKRLGHIRLPYVGLLLLLLVQHLGFMSMHHVEAWVQWCNWFAAL